MIDRSPWRRGLLPVIQEQEPKALSEAEVAQVLEVAPEQYRQLVLLALRTGLRYGELRALAWENVRFTDQPFLLVQGSHTGPTKSRKVRRVPLVEDAEELLRGMERLSEFVLPGRFGGMMGRDATSLSRVIKCAVPDFHFHRLRHTFATRYLEAGGSTEFLRVILGHSTVKLTERYGRVSDEAVWTQMRSLSLKLPKTGDKTGDSPSKRLVTGGGNS